MKNILKNKIMIAFLLFLFVLLVLSGTKTFAKTYDLGDYKNRVGSRSYVIVYKEETDMFYLFVSEKENFNYFVTHCHKDENGNSYIDNNVHCSMYVGERWNGGQCNYYVYEFNHETLQFGNVVYYNMGSPFNKGDCLIIASNYDIYEWGSSTPFFQATPLTSIVSIPPITEVTPTEAIQAETTPVETTTVEIATVEQIPVAMITTMKTIIPVGLVILSTFLVILLVKSVIWRMV